MPSFLESIRQAIGGGPSKQQNSAAANAGHSAAVNSDALHATIAAYKRGDYEASLAYSERLRGRGGAENAMYRFFHGVALMQLGNFAEAEKSLRKAIELEQDERHLAYSRESLGQLLSKQERYDEAWNSFNAGLSLRPGKPSLIRDMAELHLRRGTDAQGALRLARTAVEAEAARKGPPDGDGQSSQSQNLATLAWALANAGGARDEVDGTVGRAVEELPEGEGAAVTSQVHYQCGIAYAVVGDHDRCLAHMEAAVRADPSGLWGRDARAMSQALTGAAS